MASHETLTAAIRTIGSGQSDLVASMLHDAPALAVMRLDRRTEFFVPWCHAQVYEGDTLLHAAAFAYEAGLCRLVIALGADVRARNRRGAEPLHAAAIGAPGSSNWNPARQVETIAFLIDAGADPNAKASGGVTPLHRAVRNRCSAAVDALLRFGADPHQPNDNGSTVFDLARWTTGRSGSGSPEAKAEQAIITAMLAKLR